MPVRRPLRSVQRTHQAGEFNDIAYNFGVCPHGSVYELRGWNRQTGANGTTRRTRRCWRSYMAGTGDPLSQTRGRRPDCALYNEAFRRGVAIKAVGHGSVAPRDGLPARSSATSWRRVWRPAPPSTKIKFVLMDGEGKQLAESMAVDGATATLRRKRLAAFLNNQVATIDKELGQDKDASRRRRRCSPGMACQQSVAEGLHGAS